jgi:hypothetical protein
MAGGHRNHLRAWRASFTGAAFGDETKFTDTAFGDNGNFIGATFGDWAMFTRATVSPTSPVGPSVTMQCSPAQCLMALPFSTA